MATSPSDGGGRNLKTSTILPRRTRGRPSKNAAALFEEELDAFCALIKQINSTLDFRVSSRGWCYILEEHGLTKGEFDSAQDLINDCRRSGRLPLNICAEDGARQADNLEELGQAVDEEAEWALTTLRGWHEHYQPISFWDYQTVYLEMVVEKIDLKSLFTDVCAKYHVPIRNAKGWSDINSRAEMALRFGEHEQAGRECILLYCGDHDPSGLNISNSMHENFWQISGATGWAPGNLEIDRFGLNFEFIRDNGLSWTENLITASGEDLGSTQHPDHRKPYVQDYIARFGRRKVEANALVVRPEPGRKLCEDTVLRYLSQDGIQRYEQELSARRAELQEKIATRRLQP
jgi:hypothetical protein